MLSMIVMQASSLVDPSQYNVDIESWKAQYSGEDCKSQVSMVMSGCKICLDALEDQDERQQAKEYVRTLGGQVRPEFLALTLCSPLVRATPAAHGPPSGLHLKPLHAGLQTITGGSQRLVQDWDRVFAVCPDSLPPAKAQQLQRESQCFGRISTGNRVNMFWVKQCRVGQTLYEPSTCSLFQPIPHELPLPGFKSVCVVISGFGDGVRRAILNSISILGGTYALQLPLAALACSRWPHVHVPSCG